MFDTDDTNDNDDDDDDDADAAIAAGARAGADDDDVWWRGWRGKKPSLVILARDALKLGIT